MLESLKYREYDNKNLWFLQKGKYYMCKYYITWFRNRLQYPIESQDLITYLASTKSFFYFWKKERVACLETWNEKHVEACSKIDSTTKVTRTMWRGRLWGLTFRDKVARSVCRVLAPSPLTWTYGILLFTALYVRAYSRKIEGDGLRDGMLGKGDRERRTADI